MQISNKTIKGIFCKNTLSKACYNTLINQDEKGV